MFYDIISTLNPELLIYDGFQPWAASHASSLNIPSVHLITTGAVTMSHFLHLFHVDEIKCDEFRFLPIHCHDNHEMRKFVEMCSSANEEEVIDIGVLCFRSLHLSKSFILINTCIEIEDKYIKYLSLLTKKEVIPIGPLIRETMDDDEHEEIIEWLQKKEESSCVLASFGSEYYMSNKEIEEIARGLELSNVNFIWSLKFPTGVNTSKEEAMPRGYLERMKHKGLVVKGWVPQAKILSNKRICGFLSHCGWNSVLESLASGVPIIALPIHLDQPINARLMEEIGVGVEVVKGENGEIKGEELAKALRKVVMVGKKSGEALETSMNSKAKELSERIKLRGDKVIDGAVDKLLQLCKGKN
ncbi:unnamed protein product [Cuscuta campestris]|uniref:Uncharacterized protein n=1 Tax=Cuscuta campestris TaxID=132261 RepID=A0A484M9S5_9ASTE|nr:unnamed protein product [Cuscuta campestris]